MSIVVVLPSASTIVKRINSTPSSPISLSYVTVLPSIKNVPKFITDVE